MSYLRVWRPVSHLTPFIDEPDKTKWKWGVSEYQIGMLGELVAMEYLEEIGLKPIYEGTKTHDIKLSNGLTVDVKTTSSTFTVTGKQTHKLDAVTSHYQYADYFMFISLEIEPGTYASLDLNRFKCANIMGVLSYGELFKVATPLDRNNVYYQNGHRPQNKPMVFIRYEQLLPTTLLGVMK